MHGDKLYPKMLDDILEVKNQPVLQRHYTSWTGCPNAYSSASVDFSWSAAKLKQKIEYHVLLQKLSLFNINVFIIVFHTHKHNAGLMACAVVQVMGTFVRGKK